MERYIPTGNEMISLPKINEFTAGIEDFTYLSMQHKGPGKRTNGRAGLCLAKPDRQPVPSPIPLSAGSRFWQSGKESPNFHLTGKR